MNSRCIQILLVVVITVLTSCNSGKKNSSVSQAGSPDNVEQQQAENTDSTSGNELIIKFSMADINGKEVSVTDEFAKHEITIIDFWASWCGPCVHEMPNLVKVYNEYKDKGLGIVGVSLDEDKDQWQNAVSSMNMTWTQLSDLQGWNNSAARMYGIQAIPFTIIVDKKGKVLDAGLRGEELANFVAGRLG